MRLPKYCHFKPRNLACVIHKKRRVYLGKFDSPESYSRYADFIQALQANVNDPSEAIGPTVGMTTSALVCSLVDRYLDYSVTRYSPGEHVSMRAAAAALLDAHGLTPILEFGPLALKDVQRAMIDRGWTRSHVNHQVQRVRRIFRWGVAQELVDATKIAALESVFTVTARDGAAPDHAPIEPVDDQIVRSTLPYLLPIVAAMVRIQRVAGMRPGEICGMLVKDVDRSEGVWIFRPAHHKNAWRKKFRVIAIPPSVQPWLLPFLNAKANDPEAHVFSPRDSMLELRARRRADRRTELQPSQAKRKPKIAKSIRNYYDTNSYRQSIHNGIEYSSRDGVQLPYWTPGQLRHTAADEATELLGMRAAQRLLGHSQLATTEFYLSQQISDLIEVALQLDEHRANKMCEPEP